MLPYYSTDLSNTFSISAAEAALVDSARQSWQQVHHVLTSLPTLGTFPDDLSGLVTYHYCAYEAYGRPPAEAMRVCHLFDELVTQLREKQLEGLAWSAAQLTQACTVAWISPHLIVSRLSGSPAWLPELDETIYLEALRLRKQTDVCSRRHLVQVLRYLRLRLPATQHHLKALAFTGHLFPSQGNWSMGLDEGLAGELLGLIQTHELGLQDMTILERVRGGIRHLLSLRRQTDYLDQVYSIFPYEVALPTGEPAFSPELSWRRGDLGQSLLLYRAHDLLGDQELIKIGELVGLNTMLRTSVAATGVSTAYFHQGAAGIAYLYLKLYHISGLNSYYKHHQFWLAQMQHWLPSVLPPSYAAPQTPSDGFLHGLAGIGLVLLTSTSSLKLDWDALIL